MFEVLRQLPNSPSVQFHNAARDVDLDDRNEDAEDPDVRVSSALKDKMVEDSREFYDSATTGNASL